MKKTNALRILDRHKIKYELAPYDYDPNNLNVQVIADALAKPVEIVYKTLVLRGDKTGIIVAVIAGHEVVNHKALAKASGNKKTAMIKVKEINDLTGYIRGGCSPLGMKKDFPVYIDSEAEREPAIWVNAGKRGLLFGISGVDLQKATKGSFARIGAEPIKEESTY